MKRRLFKLVVFLLLGAIVAFPLGIALDAIFSFSTRYHPDYSDSVGLWLYGEGTDQQIREPTNDDLTDDFAGFVYFECWNAPVDMSPIFPTKTRDTRSLHVSLLRSSGQELWGKQCDPWRPMLAEYFSANGYDSRYVEGVAQPDMDRERTIWMAVWANGLIVGVVLYGIGRGSQRLVVSRIRLNREHEGYCPMCGYDLRGDFSAGCPECGWRREDVS